MPEETKPQKEVKEESPPPNTSRNIETKSDKKDN